MIRIDTSIAAVIGTTHFDGCPSGERGRGAWGADGELLASREKPAGLATAPARQLRGISMPGPLGIRLPQRAVVFLVG
jgi:hypothetical protein